MVFFFFFSFLVIFPGVLLGNIKEHRGKNFSNEVFIKMKLVLDKTTNKIRDTEKHCLQYIYGERERYEGRSTHN